MPPKKSKEEVSVTARVVAGGSGSQRTSRGVAASNHTPRRRPKILSRPKRQRTAHNKSHIRARQGVENLRHRQQVLKGGTSSAGATLDSLKRGRSGAYERLLQTVVLPCSTPPERVPSNTETVLTAVTAPWTSDTLDLRLPDSDTYYAAAGQLLYFVSRQAWCNTIMYTPNPSRRVAVYQVMFTDPSGTFSQSATIPVTQASVSLVDVAGAQADLSTAWKPHGDIMPGFYAGDGFKRHSGFWLDATPTNTCLVTFNGICDGTGFAPKVSLSQWNGRDWEIRFRGTTAAATSWTATIVVNKPGYYVPGVSMHCNSSDGQLTMTWATSAPSMAHRPMPALVNKLDSVLDGCVLGTALLITPLSAAMYRSGLIDALQTSRGISWYKVLGMNLASGFGATGGLTDDWSSLPGFQSRSAERGFYGFVKPSCAGAFDLNEVMQISEINAAATSYSGLYAEIHPPCGWMCVRLSAQTPDLLGTSYPMMDDRVIVQTAFQYTTADRWFELKEPSLSPAAVIRAITALKNCQQFHDNPMHFADLLSFLSRAARGALRVAPTLLGALRTVAPQFAPELTLASAAAGALNQYIG